MNYCLGINIDEFKGCQEISLGQLADPDLQANDQLWINESYWPEIPNAIKARAIKVLADAHTLKEPHKAAFHKAVDFHFKQQGGLLLPLFDALSDGAILFCSKGKLLHINPLAHKLLGLKSIPPLGLYSLDDFSWEAGKQAAPPLLEAGDFNFGPGVLRLSKAIRAEISQLKRRWIKTPSEEFMLLELKYVPHLAEKFERFKWASKATRDVI